MRPIEEIAENTAVCILEIKGGSHITQKLKNMGIRVGDKVQILQNGTSGPIILEKEHSRIALGRGMSKNIFVGTAHE